MAAVRGADATEALPDVADDEAAIEAPSKNAATETLGASRVFQLRLHF